MDKEHVMWISNYYILTEKFAVEEFAKRAFIVKSLLQSLI